MLLLLSAILCFSEPRGLKIEESLVSEGAVGDTFLFSLQAVPEQFIRIGFQQDSARVAVKVIAPSGEIVAQKQKISYLNAPFFLSIHPAESGVYRLETEIVRVFHPLYEKQPDLKTGSFKVVLVDQMNTDGYLKRLQSYKNDPRVLYLKENAVPIVDVDPHRKDVSDLMPLKKMIGDARVVMLGEQTHREAEAFYGKLRLIRFLHEEMDFDVVSFETDLFSANKYQSLVENPAPGVKADFTRAIYPWRRLSEFQSTMDYIVSTQTGEDPIAITGFDSQLHEAYARESLAADLKSFLQKTDLLIPDDAYFEILHHCLNRDYIRDREDAPSLEIYDSFVKTTERLTKETRALGRAGNRDASFWSQTIESYGVMLRWSLKNPPESWADMDIYGSERDIQMGKNIVWLALERFPDKKIIVWAANSHIQYNHELCRIVGRDKHLADEFLMGGVVRKALGDKAYAIAITSYEGYIGVARPGKAPEEYRISLLPDQGRGLELEEMFVYAGLDHAFLDLRNPAAGGDWLKQPLSARPFGHHAFMAPWPKVIDAFLFIRKVDNVTFIPDKE